MAGVTVRVFKGADARRVGARVRMTRHETRAAALQYIVYEHGMSPCCCPATNEDDSEMTRLLCALCDVHGSIHARFFTWTVVDDTGNEWTYNFDSASLHCN
jgi:hypothetical protein